MRKLMQSLARRLLPAANLEITLPTGIRVPVGSRDQVSRFEDGSSFFCIARTIHKDSGGYHAPQPVQTIGLGCRIEHARDVVYSDGIDLDNPQMATPVGVTCRVCERSDCEQRAFPSIRHPVQVDENVRGPSLYAQRTLRVLQ